ncbi:YbhB/YbcL family Raf kinase inhibitor-like protein [Cupriavidus sp. PET2-C1]
MTKKHLGLLAASVALVATCAASAEEFAITSSDIRDGKILNEQALSEGYGFGCKGGNFSPALAWSGAPKGTKSYLLTIYDPDAPTGFGWVHWVVANIPGNASGLPRGVTPAGDHLPQGALQTQTSFGAPGYGGPCPPEGTLHRYVITLTALKIAKLPDFITKDATPSQVGYFAKASALGETALTATYGR